MLGRRVKASELIRHHVNGTGTGYELDDLVTMGRPEHEEAARDVLDISMLYQSAEYTIGIANPASFSALTKLAERLEAKGN